MDYKTSFAAIMSFALERDLISYSVAEVINLMKSEYKTEDFSLAVSLQLDSLVDSDTSLVDSDTSVFGKYTKLINQALTYHMAELVGIDGHMFN